MKLHRLIVTLLTLLAACAGRRPINNLGPSAEWRETADSQLVTLSGPPSTACGDEYHADLRIDNSLLGCWLDSEEAGYQHVWYTPYTKHLFFRATTTLPITETWRQVSFRLICPKKEWGQSVGKSWSINVTGKCPETLRIPRPSSILASLVIPVKDTKLAARLTRVRDGSRFEVVLPSTDSGLENASGVILGNEELCDAGFDPEHLRFLTEGQEIPIFGPGELLGVQVCRVDLDQEGQDSTLSIWAECREVANVAVAKSIPLMAKSNCPVAHRPQGPDE